MKIKYPLHSNKKIQLAFEFGLMVAEVAKTQGVEVTKELSERANAIILNECQTQTASQIAGKWEALLLAVFETN